MPAIISMLRGVNVGAHNRMKMDALRAVYESLGLTDVQSYVQSGNVIFRTRDRNLPKLASRIEEGIECAFGFRPAVILRTVAEMRDAVARNPFTGLDPFEPAKLLVTFFKDDPGEEARQKIRAVRTDPEQIYIEGREMYIYFPVGMGKSKLSLAGFDRVIKIPGTGRNWNSVTKMLEMAERLETSK
jgi:uncharacterized protein (DUF1697 family)